MTNEQLDTILDFYKNDHRSAIKKTREEWDQLPKNPTFGHTDVYNACRNELFAERYIDQSGLTPKGNRFIGFVKEEQKRLAKEKQEEEIDWYTKKTFWVAVITGILTLISLIKCNTNSCL